MISTFRPPDFSRPHGALAERTAMTRQRLWAFLFPPDSGRWVTILRIGLGLQLTFFAWSVRVDWNDLFRTSGPGFVNRALTEAILSSETAFTPRPGLADRGRPTLRIYGDGLALIHLVRTAGRRLVPAGRVMLPFRRDRRLVLIPMRRQEWRLLFAYGVDNFTTIGLFYLMIAPLPDAWSLDWRLREQARDTRATRFPSADPSTPSLSHLLLRGLSKSLGADWWNGNSIWRALTRPPFNLIPPNRRSVSSICCQQSGSWFACSRPVTRYSSGQNRRGHFG